MKGTFLWPKVEGPDEKKKNLISDFFSCPCLLMRSWRRFNICFGDGRVNIWRQQRSNSFHRERASFCLTINPIIRFFSLLTPKQRSYICARQRCQDFSYHLMPQHDQKESWHISGHVSNPCQWSCTRLGPLKDSLPTELQRHNDSILRWNLADKLTLVKFGDILIRPCR